MLLQTQLQTDKPAFSHSGSADKVWTWKVIKVYVVGSNNRGFTLKYQVDIKGAEEAFSHCC